MANTQAQFGFRHIGFLSGGAPDYQMSTYPIQSTYSTLIGFGDPVIQNSTAAATAPFIIQATGSLATAGPIVGIFVGCEYVAANGVTQWSPYWVGSASTTAIGYVIDAPNAKFLVASLQTAITSANIGWVANFTTGAPATTGGAFSIATLDQSTATAAGGTSASALPFKIVGLYPGVGNGSDPTTNYNWVVVTFNNQIFKSPVGW
jgi:hypothetical protein